MILTPCSPVRKQIKWNFTKFLINKNGVVKERFSPQSEVSEIEPEIIKLL